MESDASFLPMSGNPTETRPGGEFLWSRTREAAAPSLSPHCIYNSGQYYHWSVVTPGFCFSFFLTS